MKFEEKIELMNKIQCEIDELECKLKNTQEHEYNERAHILGKINGLLTAKLLVINYETE